MNPNTIFGQSVASGVFLVLLAVLDKPSLALGLGGAGLAWWLVLNREYARALDRRARSKPSHGGRTQRRADGDRGVARQIVVANLVPIVVAAVCLWQHVGVAPHIGPIAPHYIQGFLALLSVTVVAWIASSHVDWYYIRPRLDGVVTDPPCVTSGDDDWKGVTRKWYIHRSVASGTTMVAAVAFAALLTVTLDDVAENLLAAVGGFSAIIAVAGLVMREEIEAVPSMVAAIRSPPFMLGDDLDYDTDFWKRRGYVLHVAVPKAKFVKLDKMTGDVVAPRQQYEEKTTMLFQVRLSPARFQASHGSACAVNPECVHGEARPVRGRTRLLVL